MPAAYRDETFGKLKGYLLILVYEIYCILHYPFHALCYNCYSIKKCSW